MNTTGLRLSSKTLKRKLFAKRSNIIVENKEISKSCEADSQQRNFGVRWVTKK